MSLDLLSFIKIESENYRGPEPIVIIYELIIQHKKTRQNILSNLDLDPYYKCKRVIDSCAICLNKIIESEFIRKLKCNHCYHKKCIDTWLKKNIENPNCPICRSKINLKLKI